LLAAAAAAGEAVLLSNAAERDAAADARGVVVQLLPAIEAAGSSAVAPLAAAAVEGCWSMKTELSASCLSEPGAAARAAAALWKDRFEA
jgi:hypothetical protein